jgi:hypothetical protein
MGSALLGELLAELRAKYPLWVAGPDGAGSQPPVETDLSLAQILDKYNAEVRVPIRNSPVTAANPIRIVVDGNWYIQKMIHGFSRSGSFSMETLARIAHIARNTYTTANSRVVFVFDGAPPTGKEGVIEDRAKAKAAEIARNGGQVVDVSDAIDAGEDGVSTTGKVVVVSRDIISAFVRELGNTGVKCFTADGEADHLICSLVCKGYADIPMTKDYDVLACDPRFVRMSFQPCGAQKYTLIRHAVIWKMLGVKRIDAIPRITSAFGNDRCTKLPRLGRKSALTKFAGMTGAEVDQVVLQDIGKVQGNADFEGYFDRYTESVRILKTEPDRLFDVLCRSNGGVAGLTEVFDSVVRCGAPATARAVSEAAGAATAAPGPATIAASVGADAEEAEDAEDEGEEDEEDIDESSSDTDADASDNPSSEGDPESEEESSDDDEESSDDDDADDD